MSSVEAQKRAQNEAKIKEALVLLMGIVNDSQVPRNIRRAAIQAIKILQETSLTPGVRAANAVSILDEVSQDPNMPTHARNLLWQIATRLETVKDQHASTGYRHIIGILVSSGFPRGAQLPQLARGRP